MRSINIPELNFIPNPPVGGGVIDYVVLVNGVIDVDSFRYHI